MCARVPVNLRYQIQTVAQESLGQLRRRRRFSGSWFSQKATNISNPRESCVEDGNGRDSLFLALRFMSESIYVCNWYRLYTVNVLTLKPLAVRIPEEVEKEILELVERAKLDKATIVRNLLELGIAEWRKQTALELLQEGKVTFAKAAEMAKLSLWEFADLVKQRNVEWVRFTPEEIEKELEEASAAKHK